MTLLLLATAALLATIIPLLAMGACEAADPRGE